MKKHILLTLILTVVVVGPFAYQRWRETKRLQHIREIKHLAAQIQATSLGDYLHQLKQLLKSTAKLWRETHPHLQRDVTDYATIEFLWNCTILDV